MIEAPGKEVTSGNDEFGVLGGRAVDGGETATVEIEVMETSITASASVASSVKDMVAAVVRTN